ncbi:gas vesicle protein [Alteribacillus iranensis]|uniref:Gas vesicle protein n=1 Tax=Alteribacillus iranensis TaxID=930128 RepID=A0A1I2AF24_9BACI|nr:gas vesicle protein [Alteribacillus iranensis]SFE41430.1 Gas vesicle protein [Alteribacillus iranensis]
MAGESLQTKDVSLLDVLDAVLEKGVVLKGDLTISVAGVDLVYLDLRVLLSSVETLVQAQEQESQEVVREEYIDFT